MKTIVLQHGVWQRAFTLIACIALSITLMFPIPSTNAQTTTDLQAQIAELLEVISRLQAQLASGIGTSVPGVCPATVWTRNLGIGSRGADVQSLQRFLNGNPDTRLAVSGAGSPGMETQYYGPITAAAVSDFQVKYRAQVLTPLGLVNPTGFFGPSSRAQANQLCAAEVPEPGQDEDEELSGGEASLERFDVSGVDTSLEEGEDSDVMNVEFDVEDGDIAINRIDVALDHISGGDDEPWDVFDSIAIMVDGEIIAEMNADDEDDWSDDDPENGDYTIRLTNIDDFVVREGETAEFTVVLSVAGSVDDADTGVEWEIFIPNNGIRATDSLNLNHYIGNTDETVTFDIDEEGFRDELTVRTSNDDPESRTLQLDDTDDSEFQTVFAFDLDTDDSSNDIEIESITVVVELSTSTFNELVNDLRLVIDGEEFDEYRVTNGNNASATVMFEFDNNELVIDAGDTVTAELEIEFNPLDSDLEGTTIELSVNGDDIEAEGADELTDDQLGGSASSELHTLRVSGGTLSSVETSTSVRENDTNPDTGTYTIKFDVTAFEDDIYISGTATSGTSLGTAGANYIVEDSDGDQAVGGSANAVLSSNADSVTGNRYRVSEGETREFTLLVTYTPASEDFYRVQLYSVNFNDTNAAPDVQQRALPEQNYETEFVSLDV